MKAKRVSNINYDYEYEDDQRKRGNMSPQEDEYMRSLRQPSRKSFNPNFDESPSNGGYVAAKPFFKTGKGIALITVLAIAGVLAVAGGIAGLSYYLVVSNLPVTTTTSTLTPALAIADAAIDSTVLTPTEKFNLMQLSGFRTFTLLYRGSRDGFNTNIFHNRCDNRIGTLTVYRSNLNSIYGGYTTALWNSINGYRSDSSAFIFSLRRRGFANSERFNVTNSNAIFSGTAHMATFGPHDIFVGDNPDITLNAHTNNYCSSYQCPPSFVSSSQYLAGLSNNFLITEVETYLAS